MKFQTYLDFVELETFPVFHGGANVAGELVLGVKAALTIIIITRKGFSEF